MWIVYGIHIVIQIEIHNGDDLYLLLVYFLLYCYVGKKRGSMSGKNCALYRFCGVEMVHHPQGVQGMPCLL